MQERDDWVYDHTEDEDELRGLSTPFQISYFPADFTLGGYLQKKKDGQLILPPFQRNYVWDVVKASRLIESFLLGLPVPGVFLYKEKLTNKLQVVDGQQRITSAIRFFEGRFDESIFKLKGVQDRWNGKSFDDLDESEKYQLKDSVLRATVVQQLDPDDDSSIYHVFERLNTGGVNLNAMEVRKCVNFGSYFSLIEDLNENSDWRRIIGKPNADKRLRDAELVLRVLAFGFHGDLYAKPMKQFLNKHMAGFKKLGEVALEERLVEARGKFEAVAAAVVGALGDTPFHLRGRLNFALTDVVMGALIERGLHLRISLQEAFRALLDNPEFIDSVSISTSDDKQVAKRRALVFKEFYGG